MKAFFLTSIGAIFLCLSLSATSSAQLRSWQDPKLGIKGGLNLSNFYASDVDDRHILPGFHAGLYYRAPLGEFLAIQPELLFTQKGADFSNNAILTDELSLRLSYLELPVLAAIYLGERVNVHFGPYFGILLGDPSGEISGLIDAESSFSRDNFHTIDYGLSGGIGFNLAPLVLGIRYNIGMSEIGTDDLAGQLMGNSKNSVLQFYIGL